MYDWRGNHLEGHSGPPVNLPSLPVDQAQAHMRQIHLTGLQPKRIRDEIPKPGCLTCRESVDQFDGPIHLLVLSSQQGDEQVALDRSTALAESLTSHGVSLAYLFGSQAEKGKELLGGKTAVPGPLSDLDLGVVTKDSLPAGGERAHLYASLYNDIVDLFRPFNLDLVLLEETHSVFQLEAIKGICIYQDGERQRDDYEMSILRRAADFRPVLVRFLQETLEEV